MSKTDIDIEEFAATLTKIAKNTGASEVLVRGAVDAALAHETHDNFFKGFHGSHGIDAWVEKLTSSAEIEEKLLVDRPALKIYDSNGRSPLHIILERYDEFSKLASQNGTLSVGIEGQYMSALFYIVRKFADDGYLTILSSNGCPQGTVPYGGKQDIFGTNPLAYGIPTSSDSIVFDAATSKRAYGLIAEAKRTKTLLPEDTYLTKDGEFTTDPEKAHSVKEFGGYKGYAINLLLEVMTSALVGGTAGREQKEKSELGTWLYIIDPDTTVGKEKFIAQTDRIKQEIIDTEPRDGFGKVMYPGQRGHEYSENNNNEVSIDEETWKIIVDKASNL